MVTSVTYSNSSRTTTVELPGGATEITDRFLDGRVREVLGTGVVHRCYEYGANADGMRWTKVFIGCNNGASPQWVTTTIDGLGRVVSEERPGYGAGVTLKSCSVYNVAGKLAETWTEAQGTRIQAKTLYSYDDDGLGRLKWSGQDVDGSGTLDAASTDRITVAPAPTYRQLVGFWWLETSNVVFRDSTGTPTTLSVEREQLTGLPAGTNATISNRQSVDYFGNVTSTKCEVDRSAKLVTHTVTHPTTSNTSVAVTRNGLLQWERDKGQLVTRCGYDEFGRRTIVEDPRSTPAQPIRSQWHYNELAQIDWSLAQGNTTGLETHYTYEPATGRLSSIINPLGRATRYSYNVRGQVEYMWGDVPQPIRVEYDDFGRRWKLHTYRAEAGWSSLTWPGSVTDSDVTTWIYDEPTGLLKHKTYDDGESVQFEFYPEGRLSQRAWSRSNALGQPLTTTYAYFRDVNGTGELSGITYNDSTPSVSFTYTRLGQLQQVIDGVATRTFMYSPVGPRLTEQFTAGSNLGNLLNKRLRTRYQDQVGYVDPVSGDAYITNFARLSNVEFGTAAQPALDYSAAYDYDANSDRMNKVTGPGLPGSGANYVYLPSSHLLQRTDFKSGGTTIASVSAEYEADSNLLKSVTNNWLGPTPASFLVSKYEYRYDALDRRTSGICTGSAFTASGSGDHFDGWSYNDRNELTGSARYVGAFTETPDPQNARPELDRSYAYDPIGNRTSATEGETSTRTYSTNPINQYFQIRVANPLAGQGLLYDNDGNLRESYVTSDIDGDGDVDQTDMDMLTANFGATCSPPPGHPGLTDEEFTRADADGNCVINIWDLTTLASYMGSGDSSGRMCYSWDAENRLTAVEPPLQGRVEGSKRTTFVYDYLNRRIERKVVTWDAAANGGNGDWRTTPTEWKRWVYFEWMPILAMDVDPDGNGTVDNTIVRKYTWGLDLSQTIGGAGGIGGLLALRDTLGTAATTDDRTFLYFSDAGGNVVQLLETTTGAAVGTVQARYEYDAYGKLLLDPMNAATSGAYASSNDMRFSSKQYEESIALTYFGERFYSSSLGRWLSRDRLDELDDVQLYRYCGNEPISYCDPLGLWRRREWEKLAGRAIAETCEESLKKLADAITGNPEDAALLDVKQEDIKKGTLVDISPLLRKLDERIRDSIVANTSGFSGTFPAVGSKDFCNGRNLTEAEVRSFFAGNKRTVDCLGAVRIVMSKGLIDNLKAGEFDKIFKTTNGTPIKTLNATSLADVRLGEWTYFENDSAYLKRHPGGGYQGENVIKTGDDSYWGFPAGNKSAKDWEKRLLEAFNEGLPKSARISKVPGFNHKKMSLDATAVGERVFDHRTEEARKEEREKCKK